MIANICKQQQQQRQQQQPSQNMILHIGVFINGSPPTCDKYDHDSFIVSMINQMSGVA